MNRQLIICCDGTNNNLTGRRNDTNVAQLCELLAPDAQNQLLYYDPGVGNSGTFPGATWTEQIQQKWERLSSLAFGSGIYENIAEAYRFLMRNWREGDEIFLFGFSRGAFTARSLGGMVTQFGILRPEMEVMLPTLIHLYFLDRDANQAEFTLIKNQVADLFASDAARTAPVWFVGVWDTVESVGAPLPLMRKKISAKATIVNKRFMHVRQALALDEYRFTFAPRPYWIEQGYDYAAKGQSITQEWFSGGHSDVGGGYANDEAGLSAQTLLWMVDQATSPLCKLRINPALLAAGKNADEPDHTLISKLLDERSKLRVPRGRLVHSETYSTPWWGLAGLTVRDPVVPMKQADAAIKLARPIESPVVAVDALQFPKDTVWRTPRGWGWLLFAAFMYAVFATIAGAFHVGPNLAGAKALCSLPIDWMNSLHPVASANLCFANWQLAWFAQGQAPSAGISAFHSPNRAVAVDFFIIASYGYLLARAAGWAFARRAGLRRVGMKPSKILNYLGMAPLFAILGDIAENLMTWLTIAAGRNSFLPLAEYVVGVFMSTAAAIKWLALLASLALILWGCFAKRDQLPP